MGSYSKQPQNVRFNLSFHLSALHCSCLWDLQVPSPRLLQTAVEFFFPLLSSGAAAPCEANARLGGRLQLRKRVQILSRAALWPALLVHTCGLNRHHHHSRAPYPCAKIRGRPHLHL